MRRLLPSLSICLLLAACSSPTPPAHQDQPQPQAAAPAAAPSPNTTSPITETANAYKGAAQNAVNQTEDAAAQEKAQLDQAAQ